MGEAHRLRSLDMGVARQDQVNGFRRTLGGNALQSHKHSAQQGDLFPQPQAYVGDHLVVSAPTCVQFTRYRADLLGETSFIGRVDVLIARLQHKGPRLPLTGYALQSRDDLVALRL
jgi:hypothetical protein